MKKVCSKIMKDSIYGNSVYLIMSTAVMSALGFLFWMVCTRLFSEENVGLATTMISVASLITSVSLLGLGTGIARYLPKSQTKNDKINSVFTVVGIAAIIVSTIFILGIWKFSPKLIFIKENAVIAFLFIITMVFTSFHSLVESVFVAFRSAKYVLLKNSVFSIVKLIFPFLMISFGAYGIFGSWAIGTVIGVLVSFFILVNKFNFEPKLVFYDEIIKRIGKYSFWNYLAGFISSLPALILPLIITDKINPETTAYYYMAMMIAGIIFIIPNAAANSLLAEGSYNEKALKVQLKKSRKIIMFLLIPAIAGTIILGKYVLLLFGKTYSSEGYLFLSLLAVSSIFVSINALFCSCFKIKFRIKEIVLANIIASAVILGLSYLLLDKMLAGIGLAWIIGQAVASITYLIMWLIKKN